jgi:hypothetical protein
MKINSKDFRVRPGAKVKLKDWPTAGAYPARGRGANVARVSRIQKTFD